MTENEALEEHKKDCRRCRDKACTYGVDCLQKKDIEVYEELLKYREIGTPEGYESAIQSSMEYYNQMKEYKAKVQEYESIGTIEEFKALKEEAEAYRNKVAEELEGIYAKPCVDECRVIIRKAVDDFIKRLEDHTQVNWIDHQEYGITWADIHEVAEQMRELTKGET